MKPEEITAQIMGAWDEIQAEEEARTAETESEIEVPATPEPDETEPTIELTEEDDEEEPDEDEEPDEETEGEPGDEVSPEIQAFLAKYGGDMDAALKAAVELQKAFSRRDEEKAALLARAQELEAQLVQARAFQGEGFLTQEQAVWVEEAAQSGNPAMYVQGAVDAGEFNLARAVCREWARENPYEAMRAGQVVDAIEYQAQSAAMQPAGPVGEPIDTQRLLNALADNFPGMREYEPQMIDWFNRLGPEHPFVQAARGNDLNQAAAALVSIFELARSAAVTDAETRTAIKKKHREQADDVRRNGQVASAASSPSPAETPRSVRLGPGLTLEQLEAEFAK